MAKKETKKGNNTKAATTKKTTSQIKTTTSKKTTTKKTEPKKTTTKKVPVKKEQVKKVEPKKVEKEEVKKVEVKETVKESKNNIFTKKNIIILSSILVAIILIIIIIFCLTNKKTKVTKSIKNMGKDFYTNYYYKELSKNKSKKQVTDILSRFKDKGIKINLKNLSIYNSGKYKKEIESYNNKDKKCNMNKTKVVIYPKNPYGINDYKVDVILDCEF